MAPHDMTVGSTPNGGTRRTADGVGMMSHTPKRKPQPTTKYKPPPAWCKPFLRELGGMSGGVVSQACLRCGVSRATVWRRYKSNPRFKRAMDAAREVGTGYLVDTLTSELIRRSPDPTYPGSAQLLMRAICALDPRWRWWASPPADPPKADYVLDLSEPDAGGSVPLPRADGGLLGLAQQPGELASHPRHGVARGSVRSSVGSGARGSVVSGPLTTRLSPRTWTATPWPSARLWWVQTWPT